MKLKHQRLLFLVAAFGLLVLAVTLSLQNFREELIFYYTPSELQEKAGEGERLRLGGLVQPGSIEQGDGEPIRFRITDGKAEIVVEYQGALPSLFREGQGVVAEGILQGKHFTATRILAKHDENYMPPEVARLLKEQGHWKKEDAPPQH